jgi:hypothetical protein
MPRYRPLAAVLLLSVASTTMADPVTAVVVLEKPGVFEVIDGRLERESASALLPFGEAVEAALKQNADEGREQEIFGDHADEKICREHFLPALVDELETAAVTIEQSETKPPETPVEKRTLRLQIHSCGFRKFRASASELRPFFIVDYQLLHPGEAPTREFEQLFLVGASKKTWDDYVAEPELTVATFHAEKARAGRRLAQRLLFSVAAQ